MDRSPRPGGCSIRPGRRGRSNRRPQIDNQRCPSPSAVLRGHFLIRRERRRRGSALWTDSMNLCAGDDVRRLTPLANAVRRRSLRDLRRLRPGQRRPRVSGKMCALTTFEMLLDEIQTRSFEAEVQHAAHADQSQPSEQGRAGKGTDVTPLIAWTETALEMVNTGEVEEEVQVFQTNGERVTSHGAVALERLLTAHRGNEAK